MKYIITGWLLIFAPALAPVQLKAQSNTIEDEEEVENSFQFKPGIYLSFQNFIENNPIPPENIQTDRNPKSRDFYFQLFKEGSVTVSQDDSTFSIKTTDLWGYANDKAVYASRSLFKTFLQAREIDEHPFAKITIIGKICLIYYIKTLSKDIRLQATINAKQRPAEFILNTADGKIYKATNSNLTDLLKDDPELLKEYNETREDQNIKFYIFLKKYNERNPLVLKG
jgi:hypothetical protein